MLLLEMIRNSQPQSWVSRTSGAQVQALGEVALQAAGVQPRSAKPDMAVGTQQVERRAAGIRARASSASLAGSAGIAWTRSRSPRPAALRRRRLPDHDQVEARVVELREQILDRAVRPRA